MKAQFDAVVRLTPSGVKTRIFGPDADDHQIREWIGIDSFCSVRFETREEAGAYIRSLNRDPEFVGCGV